MEVKHTSEDGGNLSAPLLSASSSTFIWMDGTREKFAVEDEMQANPTEDDDYLYYLDDGEDGEGPPADLIDCASYLKILFPYASSNQISKAIHAPHVRTLHDAAMTLYRELNPQNDVSYVLQEEKRCKLEHRNGLPTHLLDGVSTAWKRRIERLQGCDDGSYPPVSELGLYESCVHVLPVDTSAWDEELLWEETSLGFKYDDLPLTAYATGPAKSNARAAPSGCSTEVPLAPPPVVEWMKSSGTDGKADGGNVNGTTMSNVAKANRYSHNSNVNNNDNNDNNNNNNNNNNKPHGGGGNGSSGGEAPVSRAPQRPLAPFPMTEAELFGRLDEGVEYLAGTPLAAPILRWAPDIAVMVPGTPSSAGTDTNFTDDLFYINGIEKRCSFLVVPKDMMSGASLGSHEPFFEEEDHNRADGRIHLYLTTTPRKRSGPTPSSEATRLQKKNDDSQQEGAPYNIPSPGSSSSRTTTGFNVVSVMTTEKRRFEGCLTLLQPYADIFGNRDKCNLIKTISAYAPTAKTLLPLHMSQIATLIPVLATKDVLTRGLSDIPVSLPLLGKKLVTLGPISIRELELDDKDEKKAAAAAKFAFEDDGASAAVKLKVKKVRLNPVSFSYISQSAAAKQLFYDNYVDPRPGMETNIIGPRPFSDTTTGVAEVTLGKVNVKGSLRVFVYTGGNMDLRLHKPKVSIGSLTLDSTVTKINVMAVILKPILKCAIESALEDALSGGTFP